MPAYNIHDFGFLDLRNSGLDKFPYFLTPDLMTLNIQYTYSTLNNIPSLIGLS